MIDFNNLSESEWLLSDKVFREFRAQGHKMAVEIINLRAELATVHEEIKTLSFDLENTKHDAFNRISDDEGLIKVLRARCAAAEKALELAFVLFDGKRFGFGELAKFKEWQEAVDDWQKLIPLPEPPSPEAKDADHHS